MPLVIDIFLKLITTIGLVFFVLSTISIISQSWLSASGLPQSSNPYILYGVSNIGSFLALLTYPFLFEYFFDLNAQLNIWRAMYFVFVVIYFITFKTVKCIKTPEKNIRLFNPEIFLKRFEINDSLISTLYWFLLSAASSTMFLSVTNLIVYKVAPCPLFWIIPLCIYLLSFVLNFKQNPWCPSWVSKSITFTLGFSAILFFLSLRSTFPFLIYAAAYFVSLFVICMFCQNEIYVTRPKEKDGLTGFYVVIAVGSVMGSMLVTWFAPILFYTSPLEYLVGLLLISLALLIKKRKLEIHISELRWVIYAASLLVLWPVVFKNYNIFGLIIIYFTFKALYGKMQGKPALLCLTLIALMFVSVFTVEIWNERGHNIYSIRNYYGLYDVAAGNNMLLFYNGNIGHGAQFIDKEKKSEPLLYYHRHSPVGKVMGSDLFDFRRVGIVGLGAGTLAAYGKPGQEIDFFELDPDVYRTANLCFTYLKDSAAKINFVFGDARIELNKIPRSHYDLLIIDAFSGDSVPTHLLTTDAIREYKEHLQKGGIILFHISNKYLDLGSVLFANAGEVNSYVSLNVDKVSHKDYYRPSYWVAMTWDKDKDDILSSRLGWVKKSTGLLYRKVKPWSDNYSNILSVFKTKQIIEQIKNQQ